MDVAQDLVDAVVGERHAVDLDRAGHALERDGVGRIADRWLRVQDLEHPGHGSRSLAELAVEAGDAGQAATDRDPVEQEPGERPDPQVAVDHLVTRVPQQHDHGAEAQEPHQRAEAGAPQREARALGHDAGQVRAVALCLEVLADVALDHADPAQRLLRGPGAPGDRVLDLGADALERPAEHDGDGDERRGEEQRDKEQRRAEEEQDDDRADEPDDRRQERGRRLGEHGADEGHVARQARDELADPAAGVEVQRQRHEALEQLAPHLGDDPLPHHAQEVGLHEAAQRLGEEQHHEPDDQRVEGRGVAAGNDLRDEACHDEGHEQREARPQDEPDQRQAERGEVRTEVAEQAPPRHATDDPDPAGDLARHRWRSSAGLHAADHATGLSSDPRVRAATARGRPGDPRDIPTARSRLRRGMM